MNLEKLIIDILRKQKGDSLSLKDIADLCNEEYITVCDTLSKMELEGRILHLDEGYKIMSSSFKVGQVFTNSKGHKYIINNDGERLFLNCDLCGVKEYDTVVVELFGRKQGEIKKIIKRDDERALFEVIDDGVNKCFRPIGNSIKLKLSDDDHLVDGDIIYVNVGTQIRNGYYEGKLDSVVGHRDDPNIKIKQIALAHNIDINFSKEAIDELKNIPSDISGEYINDRVDLRDEKIFTIDGIDTKDIDDAISIRLLDNGNFELGVHIADVSHYVHKDSSLFKDAYQRGTSVYLANSVIPMIPHQLSNGICSLNPGVDRLALSCIIEIDSRANIIAYDIFKSVINSKMKMTYEDVNKIIEEGKVADAYEDYLNEITLARKLSKLLNSKTKARGKLDFDSNESKLSFGENGEILSISKREQKAAEEIIENFMICTNEVVASEFGLHENLPFVYRVHEEPDDKTIDKVIDSIEKLGHSLKGLHLRDINKLYQVLLAQCSLCKDYPVTSSYILRSMPKAKYSVDNCGHFGLGSEIYTHFTSPIRRLPDLLIHTVIKEHLDKTLDKRKLNNIKDYLAKASFHASKKEREAARAESDVFKLKCIEYIKEHPDEVFTANIMVLDNDGIEIRTDNLISGRISFDSLPLDTYFNGHSLKSKQCKLELSVADEILVKACSYDEDHLSIDFNLEAVKEKAKQYKKSK